jgi:hypothetical protein
MSVLLTADIWLYPASKHNCGLARRRQRRVPYPANHGGRSRESRGRVVLNRSRATTLWENRRVISRASRLVQTAMTIAHRTPFGEQPLLIFIDIL